MQQYLLSVIEPEGDPPPAEEMAAIIAAVEQLNREAKEAGVWVFSGGLHSTETATVLRPQGKDVLTIDGPYAEGKEHLGGIMIVQAADLDAALEWGRKAVVATTLPIEVRPFQWAEGG